MRQASRMQHLSDGVVSAKKVVIADFIAPTAAIRVFEADYMVWMDTIKEGRFNDTNKMFQSPPQKDVNYHVSKWFDDTDEKLVDAIHRHIDVKNRGE